MAIVVQSYSQYDAGTGSSIILPKPSGVLVGELLLVHIMQSDTNGAGYQTITPPGTFTLLQSTDDGTGAAQIIRCATYWRITDSTDLSATSYTFTSGGDICNQGTCIRISGTDLSAPYVFSVQAGGSTAIPTVTPAIANSLLILAGFHYANASTASGYSIVTSNPVWTELYDFIAASGTSSNMAMATALRSQTTATGSGNITFSVAPGNGITVARLIGLSPGTVVSITDTLTTTDRLGAGISITLSDMLSITDTVIASLATVWTNATKNISTWINQIKH